MSNEPRAGMSVDPEMLAAYIDKRLSPEQRAQVEAQLAADPDSYALLVETLKAQDAFSQPVPAKRTNRSWVMAASVLAAAAAVALAVWINPGILERLRGDRVDPRFERLVAAVGNERYVEARLSGGFQYGAVRALTRSSQALPAANLSLVAAAGELQKEAERNPTAENLHAWGTAQVLLGQFDGAIEALSNAAQKSDDRGILSDLAAAYVSRATATARADDWPKALAMSSKAIEGALPPLPEALFNRALAAEALNLTSVAREAWTAYLDVESAPQWRAEAQQHLERLNSKPQSWRTEQPSIFQAASLGDDPRIDTAIAKYSQKIRESVEDDLLRRWAQEQSSGGVTADASLNAATRLSDRLAEKTGDRLLAETTHAIERLAPQARADVARGLLHYAAGRDAYERAAMQDSVARFSAAKDVFDRFQLPLSEWCELYLATASYYRGDYPATSARITTALGRVEPAGFLAVTARLAWLAGLIATQQAEFDRSLAQYGHALSLFERMGESENQGAMHSLLATALLYVGDQESVWSHTVRSLQARSSDSTYRRQHMVLIGAANRAARLDLSEAALAFADEAAAVNRLWNDPIARVEIASYRSRALVRLQRPLEAQAEINAARNAMEQIADRGLKQRAEAEVMQTSADVLAVVDPKAGVDAATRAIDYFKSSRSVLRIPRLYAVRASARSRLGDADGARADLSAGAASFDAERATLPRSERLRLAYSDEVWNMYRALVGAEVEREASCEAVLTAANRARASMQSLARDESLSAAALQLGSRTGIVSYTFVDARLVIVALRDQRCEYRVVDASADEVQQRVAALRSELSGGADPPLDDAPSIVLFRQLLQPVWHVLQGIERLEIVADGPLHHLPFSTLRTAQRTQLIELAEIRMIPSVAISGNHTRASREALVSSGGQLRALDLPPLPGVKVEIAAVTEALRRARFGTKEANDAASFLAQLPAAGVIHFAGHAVVNEEYPLLSRLVLAGTDRDEWVTAEQITSSGPITPRLVFLSACSTQAGRLFGGEGPASLARSFLSAGAMEVVASLWPVSDRATGSIVTSFYRHWSKSGDASRALRQAILDHRTEARLTPQEWAAWVVVGRRAGATSGYMETTH